MQAVTLSRTLVLAAVLSACSADDDTVVVDLGVIVGPDQMDPVIEHPEVLQRGVDIPVTVTTLGDDCTWADHTDVVITGLTAVIKPFDKSATDSPCADTIFMYKHSATVRFEESGTATITVVGYKMGDRFGSVIERSRSLEIQ